MKGPLLVFAALLLVMAGVFFGGLLVLGATTVLGISGVSYWDATVLSTLAWLWMALTSVSSGRD